MDCLYVDCQMDNQLNVSVLKQILYKPYDQPTIHWKIKDRNLSNIKDTSIPDVLYFENEDDLITHWFYWWIQNRKGGVLLGHNIHSSDIPYLRAKLIQINIEPHLLVQCLSKWTCVDTVCILELYQKKDSRFKKWLVANYKLDVCAHSLFKDTELDNKDTCEILLQIYNVLCFPTSIIA